MSCVTQAWPHSSPGARHDYFRNLVNKWNLGHVSRASLKLVLGANEGKSSLTTIYHSDKNNESNSENVR